MSSRKKIISGVSQGSILGLKSTTPGLYADDTQIFASSDNFDELVDMLNSDLEIINK